jgi:hypothetical protein
MPKMVLSKKILMHNAKNKAHELTRDISSFKKIFTKVINHGFPSLWDGNWDICSLKNYQKILDVGEMGGTCNKKT